MSDMILFWDIGLIIVVATFLAYLAQILRQPLILAYIIAGILIGPTGFGLITNRDVILTLSEFGIAFFLFIIGLELDIKKLKNYGFIIFITGIGQVVFTFFIGFIIIKFFGFADLEAIYLALALTFSSTMIVVKLLSDKNELDTLHGRIILGILLIQDVAAIVLLALMPNILNLSLSSGYILSLSLVKGLGLFSIAIVMSIFVLPYFLDFASKSQELLFLFAISWCFIFSTMSYYIGYSVAIGAFLAGISLASFPYNVEIVGRVRSLRDFFATIFFVSLGMMFVMGDVSSVIAPIIILSLFVLIGNPFIVILLTSFFGYGKRTSFLTSIAIAQVSEFSLILVVLGLKLGHISQQIVTMTTVIAIITITITTYLIKYDEKIYRMLSRYLNIFERTTYKKEELIEIPHSHKKHVVVAGCHRMGFSIIKTLQELKKDFLVVEFDPDIIKVLKKDKIHCIYGDLGDLEILDRIDLKDAEIVISTIPRMDDNILLIEKTREINPGAMIFVTADTVDQALQLYNIGADYVFLPRILSGEKASELVEKYVKNTDEIKYIKRQHIVELEKIKKDELFERYWPDFLRSLEKKFHIYRK